MELQDPSGATDRVAECIQNMHGNHVIQKCIEQMPPDSVNFIIDSVKKSVDAMAEHMYGCRIIQRLLEHCAPHQLQEMLESIRVHTKRLAENPYGNYVVQHMLEHGRPEDKKAILTVVANNITVFAKNKCSSNVVEKCFEIASIGEHADALKEGRQRLYAAVLEPRPGQPLPIQELTDDKFGNYIVQRMLEYSRDAERETLKNQLITLAPQLQNSTNGKHICSALTKEFGIAIPGQTPNEQ
jgi:pumilio RNA-binding family